MGQGGVEGSGLRCARGIAGPWAGGPPCQCAGGWGRGYCPRLGAWGKGSWGQNCWPRESEPRSLWGGSCPGEAFRCPEPSWPGEDPGPSRDRAV